MLVARYITVRDVYATMVHVRPHRPVYMSTVGESFKYMIYAIHCHTKIILGSSRLVLVLVLIQQGHATHTNGSSQNASNARPAITFHLITALASTVVDPLVSTYTQPNPYFNIVPPLPLVVSQSNLRPRNPLSRLTQKSVSNHSSLHPHEHD